MTPEEPALQHIGRGGLDCNGLYLNQPCMKVLYKKEQHGKE